MSKKLIFGIVAVIVLIAGVVAGIFLIQRRQSVEKSADPATSLTLVTADLSPDVGDTIQINAEVATNENEVAIVQIDLTFDTDSLEFVSASPGTFFLKPQEIGPTEGKGTVVYAVGVTPGSNPVQGTGIVATFSFKAVGSGITTIDYGPKTSAGAINEDSNVIAFKTPLTLNINDPAGSSTGGLLGSPPPSPEATASATPSATPVGGTTPTSTPTTTPVTSTTISATPQTLPDTATITPTMVISGAGIALLLLFGVLLFAI